MERGVEGRQFWVLRRGSKEPSRLDVPDGQTAVAPLVSEDGGWVARLTRSPDRESSLRIEPLGSGQPIVFSHPLLQRTTLVLVELDMNRREVVVNRDLSAFAKLSLDGTVVWGPLIPGAIEAQSHTFLYLDGQWAAWDAYVENTRYRLAWSTQKGKGQYRRRKGDPSRRRQWMREGGTWRRARRRHWVSAQSRTRFWHSGPAAAAKYSGKRCPPTREVKWRSLATRTLHIPMSKERGAGHMYCG